jgi:hypothetical protein
MGPLLGTLYAVSMEQEVKLEGHHGLPGPTERPRTVLVKVGTRTRA